MIDALWPTAIVRERSTVTGLPNSIFRADKKPKGPAAIATRLFVYGTGGFEARPYIFAYFAGVALTLAVNEILIM